MHRNPDQPPHRYLEDAPLRVHGVLVRVHGVGVLLIGESGIGKSECALELISRGHRLVADDAVDVAPAPNELIGTAPHSTSNLLEIRGLGVINVENTFGAEAISKSSTIDLCVELKKAVDVERVGNFIHEETIGGLPISKFILPVTPGRNLAVLVETAARLLKNRHRGAAAGDALLAGNDNVIEHPRSV